MESDSLGTLVSSFRTSRIQAIVLFAAAAVLAGLSAWLYALDQNIGTPFALVGVPASLFLLIWGGRLAFTVLEVREHGVWLRFLIRRVDIPYSEIVSIQRFFRTVNGLPGSAKAIGFDRADGSRVVFPLESNVDEACNQIAGMTTQNAPAEPKLGGG